MTTISLQDEIYATLTQRGIEVAKIKTQGIKSISELLMKLRALASNCVGMVTLKVRNYSQGWSQCRNVKLMPLNKINSEAVQLSLF